MANEKKKQTSIEKKKTTQAKTKPAKKENQKSKEAKVVREEKITTNQLEKKSVDRKVPKKNIKEVTNQKKSDDKKEYSTSKKKESNSQKIINKETSTKNFKNKSEKMKSSSIVSSDEMGKLTKIILVLVVIAIAFYGLTVIITKFQKPSVPDRNKNIVPAAIQYDEILIGTMLNQSRDEYYVLIQKDDDQYQTLTSYYLQRYSTNSKSLKVYMSNINSIYNQFYISETSNIRTNNMSEFRVSTITLVKIKNHEIVEAYEGLDEVENAFKKLVDNK